ncbi:hypothetical protein SCHIN_v1c03930 [Spiroplasma chinense]|uniref:Uncharacterized protein n=2 Tax=Spiroplasma chinense TaxID=216932 RepID=A0A5B9Y3R6_9MOLU|nr:hypothetical protein SCHIN_v1c03930 [Spiroplasma chinense]
MFLAGKHDVNWNGNALSASNFLILLIVSLLAVVLPLAVFVKYCINIKRSENKKVINKLFVVFLISTSVASLATCIVGWIFFYGKSFSAEMDPDLAWEMTLSMIVVTYALCCVWYMILLFIPQKIWIELKEEGIGFPGMDIKAEKIINIINDEESKKLYINYLEGKRKLKKISIPRSTVLGQFLLENSSIVGVTIEVKDQLEFFKDKTKELKLEYLTENEAKRVAKSSDDESKEA